MKLQLIGIRALPENKTGYSFGTREEVVFELICNSDSDKAIFNNGAQFMEHYSVIIAPSLECTPVKAPVKIEDEEPARTAPIARSGGKKYYGGVDNEQ